MNSQISLLLRLNHYSKKGTEYVETLQGIIKTNRLSQLDNVQLSSAPCQLNITLRKPLRNTLTFYELNKGYNIFRKISKLLSHIMRHG